MPDLYDATDLDYNADSRVIESKIEIFFDPTPITVDKDDFLIDWDVLEEVGTDSNNNPIGDTSANDFSFSLFNEEGIFSPANTAGPYYGKIKSGVKVIPYLRTKNTNWIQMGVFYVNEWNATITSLRAEISCYDDLNRIFNSDAAKPDIRANITFAQAFAYLGATLGISPLIDSSLVENIPWWYVLNTNKDTIQKMAAGTVAACFCNRMGIVTVTNMLTTKEVRAIITDQDQLITAETQQSLTKEFDGAIVTLNKHQLTAQQEVLNIKDLVLPVGLFNSNKTQFNISPIVRLECVQFISENTEVQFQHFIATPYDVIYRTNNNTGSTQTANLTFLGRGLEIAKTEFYKNGLNPIINDNVYVQTDSIATHQKEMLTRLVNSNLAYLDIEIRGNPLLQLGDKITVNSERYAINFTGYILRQQFTYTGALRAHMRLIAANILEVGV